MTLRASCTSGELYIWKNFQPLLSIYCICTVHCNRFNVKWIKNVTLQTYGNIDNSDLKEKTKEYLKGLHKRTNKKELLAKRPSSGDFEVLVKAYGEIK